MKPIVLDIESSGIDKTEKEFRSQEKQSQKDMIIKFFKWVAERKVKNFLCQNPQFDFAFLEIKARKYGLKIPFHYRSFDLHSIAQMKFHLLNKKFLIKEDHSDMGLTNILEFCGMQDNRKSHNALEDCRITGECFSRLIDRRKLFREYSQFEIPEYLREK